MTTAAGPSCLPAAPERLGGAREPPPAHLAPARWPPAPASGGGAARVPTAGPAPPRQLDWIKTGAPAPLPEMGTCAHLAPARAPRRPPLDGADYPTRLCPLYSGPGGACNDDPGAPTPSANWHWHRGPSMARTGPPASIQGGVSGTNSSRLILSPAAAALPLAPGPPPATGSGQAYRLAHGQVPARRAAPDECPRNLAARWRPAPEVGAGQVRSVRVRVKLATELHKIVIERRPGVGRTGRRAHFGAHR